MQRRPSSALLRYGIAVASIAGAVALRRLLDPVLGDSFPFAFLFVAVLITARYSGFEPALLATGLGAVASIAFLLPDGLGVSGAGATNLGGLILYVAVSLGIATIGRAMRSAQLRAELGSTLVAAERENLRVTLESIGDAVIATDMEGRITSMNAVAATLTGWRSAEVTGRPLDEVFRIVNEKTRQPGSNPVRRVLIEGRVVGLANHTVLISRNGTETPIDDSAAPIRDQHGRLVGVVLVFRDVAARRHAEIRLQQSQQELNDFFENANVGLHWVGPDGKILRANRAELELLGYDREEYVGRHINEFHVDRGVIDDILRRLTAGETLESYPAQLRCKDGSIKDVLINSSVLREGGRFLHTRCFTLDVTGQRRAEEAQALLASVVESSEDAIITKTLEGIIASWNRGAESLFGYNAAEAIGQPILLIMPPERHAEESSILERLRRGERIEHFETERVAKNGRRVQISLTVSPVRDAGGRVIGVSKVARDITERKRSEERLRTLAAVVEQSNDFIGLSSPDMVPFFVNEAGRRMVGLDSMDEVRKTSVLDYFWPEDRPRIQREAVPSLLRDGHWSGEVRFRHFKTGQPIHTLWNVTAIRNDAGEPIAWATVSPNLDAVKETERALHESRAQLADEAAALHRLHELSGRLTVSSDLANSLDDALGAAIALLGADKGNVQLFDESRGVLEIVAHQGFDAPFLEHFRSVRLEDDSACARAQRTGARVVIEDVDRDPAYAPHRAVAAEAGYRAVQSTPLIGRKGRLLGMLSTHFRVPYRPDAAKLRLLDLIARLAADLIERVRDEASLRESEERFRGLADNISQLAWIADESGSVLWYNRRWLEYTGSTFDSIRGRDWIEVQHPEHLERVMARIQHSLDTGDVWEDTFPLRGKDGRYRWFLSRATPMRDEAGRVQRWFGTNTDITDQREAEEALRDADRRKDEFLATLAHELRNPLAPVRSSLELMKRAEHDAPVVEQARRTMDRQMSHLERLVDDLLDVSRITRDKLDLRTVPVELASVVHQAVETCRPLADTWRHDVALSLPDDPIYLRADPVRLAQIVSNLLSNAYKYTDPGGRITLAVHRRENVVEISVRDTGLGISAEMLPRVFDMFTQVPGSTERPQGGLGVGLALVRRLVEMHGGEVTAFSEGLNRGSEFVVRLPIVAPDDEASCPKPARTEPAAAEPAPVRRRVLVVDDNRDAAESLAMLLEIIGHETRLAHDGEEAISAAEAFRPDVVLLDIGMPRMSGHDAARTIREQPWGKEMVLVALTGWGQEHDRRRSMEVGFDHHLVKPVDLAALTVLLGSLQAREPTAEPASEG